MDGVKLKLCLPHPIQSRSSTPLIPYPQIRRQYLEGHKKQALSEWWLTLIESRVDEFLHEKGYDPHAAPYDYIDQPPRSLEAVQKNLDIIHFMLDSNAERQSTVRQSLVDPLNRQVYRVIDDFLRNAEHVILNCMKEKLLFQQELLTFEYSGAFNTFNSNRSKFDEKMATQIEGLFRDIQYIAEMKRLENIFFNNGGQKEPLEERKVSDIVPISGLIFGRFHMLENELKTVLQHWSKRFPKSQFF